MEQDFPEEEKEEDQKGDQMNLIWILLFGCGLGSLIFFMYIRIIHWRSAYFSLDESYSDCLNHAMAAERDKTTALGELDYLRRTIGMIAERSIVATLTDSQIAVITQAIAQLVMSELKAPNKMN